MHILVLNQELQFQFINMDKSIGTVMGEVSNKSFLAKKTWNNIMLIVISVSS